MILKYLDDKGLLNNKNACDEIIKRADRADFKEICGHFLAYGLLDNNLMPNIFKNLPSLQLLNA